MKFKTIDEVIQKNRKNELMENLKQNFPHLFFDSKLNIDNLLFELNIDIERERVTV